MIRLADISIGKKLVTAVLAVNIVGIGVLAACVYWRASSNQTTSAMEQADTLAQMYAKDVQEQLGVPMDMARALAQIMQGFESLTPEERRADFDNMLKGLLEANPEFLAVWSCWEPNALDGLDAQHASQEGTDATGRFLSYWNRGSGTIAVEPLVDYDKSGDGDYYQIPLTTGTESIIDPYFYPIGGKEVLITSLVVPIKKTGTVVGVVGIDIEVARLQRLVENIRPYGTGVAAIFSNSGIVTAHFDQSRNGKQMRQSERDMSGDSTDEFAEAVKAGKEYSYTTFSAEMGTDIRIIAHPITIGRSTTPWSFAVGIPMNRVLAPVKALLNYTILIGLGVIAFVSITMILLTRSIVRPIRRTVDMLKDISEGDGDLTKRLEVKGNDEIGRLARHFNRFVEKLQDIVGHININVSTVSSSATELAATATQLANGAEETTNQSAQVAAAAAQMSSSMTTMSASTEEMSTNVKTVSAAVEQVTASISEMAKSAERAAAAAANATQLVDTSNAQIGELGGAADEIGKVIEVIQDIAEQTNLLALNATIEAARAGDAGKGFAVVATEVKELAKQTAGATEDIRRRIEGIQGSTGLAVKSMGGIGEVIRQVNDLSRIIASAVEEQSITTQEIARNIAQSSTAAQTVAKGVAESAIASQEIARIVGGVDQAARQTAQGASQTQSTGHELSTVAEQLRGLVGQFQV